ncbi:MAG: heparinase II/III family protein, partial [Clostridia bacterium]|nr:heparinase II/III family protein [Clostridia bacterium]
WERANMNWSAVCGGGVGCAMMYLEPDMFKKCLPRFLKALEYFFSGFPSDGACLEGVSYWNYGFGFFVYFADLLEQFTDGEINLFDDEKVKEIAKYPLKVFMKGDTCVSFSDGARRTKLSRALFSFLHNKYPEDIPVLEDDFTRFRSGNVSFVHCLRNFLYYDSKIEKQEFARADYYLPSAEHTYINKEKYSLAIKAGNNDEPHNHNDVGNFIISTENGQILCDLGAAKYTMQYFSDERYNIITCGSQGHNLPIINGKTQCAGKEYCGKMAFEDGTVTVDIANAYPQNTIDKFTRTFKYDEEKIILTDEFSEFDSIVERFVSLIEPEIFENYVKISNLIVRFNSDEVELNVSTDSHVEHISTMASGNGIATVWLIDFNLKKDLDKTTFTFEIC